MTLQLKPCPFCGSHAAEVREFSTLDYVDHEDGPDWGFVVLCNANKVGCGASTGWRETEIYAAPRQRQRRNWGAGSWGWKSTRNTARLRNSVWRSRYLRFQTG